MIRRTRFHQTLAPANKTLTLMSTPMGIESVVYWYSDAKPKRKTIDKLNPATIPLVNSPQKITVVQRIPPKMPTAAVMRRMY